MRESRWSAPTKYHQSSSSDYSSQSPPRQRRRHAYSSSDSSSSDEDDFSCHPRKDPPIFSPSTSSRTVALGRRLGLPKDLALLARNCQFVKKIVTDPALQNSVNCKEPPTYLTTTDLPKDGGSLLADPRAARIPYLDRCIPPKLQSSHFVWDTSSKGRPPSTQVLLAGFPINVTSKSLLVNLLISTITLLTPTDIIDVQLSCGHALLAFQNPICSSAVVSWLGKNTVGGDKWMASFDSEGKRFQKLLQDHKAPLGDSHSTKPTSSDSVHSSRLKCSRRIACILVSYTYISPSESSRDLEDCFRKYRLYNVERGKSHWHIHLASEEEVDRVRRLRTEFKFRGRPLDFVIQQPDPDQSETEARRCMEHKDQRLLPTKSSLGSRSSPHDRKPPLVPVKTESSRSNLDVLYQPPGHVCGSLVKLEAISTHVPRETNGEDALLNLPIFNRKILERRRAEEAAALAAEAARLELEQKIANEEQRRAILKDRREEKKLMDLQKTSGPSPAKFELSTLRVHETGCSRTQGYYSQAPAEKHVYIEDILPLIQSMSASLIGPINTVLHSSTGSSRSNRAQNRRLQASLENVKSDLFGKTSVFTARKKRLIVARSSIHSWGLFAGEDIETGDMVVEYVGELIRESVANVRERCYELALQAKGSSEMASSYFFRLSADLVIDATHKGNMSRFVNHSCDPTCVARVVSADARRIVMYARRDIRKGEEITYDYKFPLEDDPSKKIKCLCGSRNCRGTLN